MKNFISHLHTSFNSMAIGALVFIAAGYAIPNVYFSFVDSTNYYTIKNPVEVELRDYQACESAKVYMIRESLLTSQGRSIINLNLVKTSGHERVDTQIKDISFTEGSGLIILNWNIACNTLPGEYFFEGTMAYKVRGFQKYSNFKTINFQVVASESAKQL